MEKNGLPVVVIGAGLGGLTLTLALQKLGIPVAVYDQAPELAEVGAGVMLKPNARAVLRYVGIDDAVDALALRPAANHLRHWRTGDDVAVEPYDKEFLGRYGSHLLTIHRADLQFALVDAVRRNDPSVIRLNHRLTGVEAGDNEVTATFANGEQAKGAVLIGADGARSVVRSQLLPGAAARFTGNVAWRGLVPIESVRDLEFSEDTSTFVGPGHHFVCYAVQKGASINYVAIAESDSWQSEGWQTPSSVDEPLNAFEGWNPYVRALIERTPPERSFKWGLFDHDPLPHWNSGRVALLGDAAHALLPFLGQGAALSMEDAVVLARALNEIESVEDALAAYARVRADRAAWARRQTYIRTELFHGEPSSKGLSDDAKTVNETLYGYDAGSVPLQSPE